MGPNPNEVSLPSLATFQLDLAIAIADVSPERLVNLYETSALIPLLRQQETQFMQIALAMKNADPILEDWKIEELALQEVLLQQNPDPQPQEEPEAGASPTPPPSSSKIAEILEFVRNSD